MKILVTGSARLIGLQAVVHFAEQGPLILGVDNNMWMELLSKKGDYQVFKENNYLSEL